MLNNNEDEAGKYSNNEVDVKSFDLPYNDYSNVPAG